MMQLQQYLRYQLERQGKLAAASFLVLVLAIGVQLLWVDRMHAQNQTLREALSAQRVKAVQAAKTPAPDDKAQSQTEFLAGLPDSSQALDVIAVLNQAASRNQVALANTDYRLVRQGNGTVLRYQINLPLRADYMHLHAWLAEVMNALPNAALDDISFKRDDVGQTQLDARVRLSVFLRVP